MVFKKYYPPVPKNYHRPAFERACSFEPTLFRSQNASIRPARRQKLFPDQIPKLKPVPILLPIFRPRKYREILQCGGFRHTRPSRCRSRGRLMKTYLENFSFAELLTFLNRPTKLPSNSKPPKIIFTPAINFGSTDCAILISRPKRFIKIFCSLYFNLRNFCHLRFIKLVLGELGNCFIKQNAMKLNIIAYFRK